MPVHSESRIDCHIAGLEFTPNGCTPRDSASGAEGDLRSGGAARNLLEGQGRTALHECSDERDSALRVNRPGDRHERPGARRVARVAAAGRHTSGIRGVRGPSRPGGLEGPAPLQPGRKLPARRPEGDGARGSTFGGVWFRPTPLHRRIARAAGVSPVLRGFTAELRHCARSGPPASTRRIKLSRNATDATSICCLF